MEETAIHASFERSGRYEATLRDDWWGHDRRRRHQHGPLPQWREYRYLRAPDEPSWE